jgi:phage shock protein C
MKRLYRSRENRIFAGIFGGLGDYFEVDPVPLRLAGILICITTAIFPFIIGYIVACFVVPEAPKNKK